MYTDSLCKPIAESMKKALASIIFGVKRQVVVDTF